MSPGKKSVLFSVGGSIIQIIEGSSIIRASGSSSFKKENGCEGEDQTLR